MFKDLISKYEVKREFRLRSNESEIKHLILKGTNRNASLFKGVKAEVGENGVIIFKPNFAFDLGSRSNQYKGVIDREKYSILVTSKMPIMIYFGFVMCIIGIFCIPFIDGEISPMLLFIPIVPFWFYFIYKLQANWQIGKIENYMKEQNFIR